MIQSTPLTSMHSSVVGPGEVMPQRAMIAGLPQAADPCGSEVVGMRGCPDMSWGQFWVTVVQSFSCARGAAATSMGVCWVVDMSRAAVEPRAMLSSPPTRARMGRARLGRRGVGIVLLEAGVGSGFWVLC